MGPSIRIEWSDRMESGIAGVDAQHRCLVDLINALGESYGGGAAADRVAGIFSQLERYTVEHFGTEEALMRAHGLPEADYLAHCGSHRDFIALLQHAGRLMTASPDDVVSQLLAFLVKWLAFHICGEDMRMAQAIGARRDGAAAEPDGALVRTLNGLYDRLGARMLDVVALNASLRKELEHNRRLAHFDPLTGLPNRVLFRDRAEHALAQARRRHERLALLYLDVDRFKQVNDGYGHEAGDALLRDVARCLQACIRDSDIACRQGGDEFLALLTAVCGEGEAAEVAGRILAAVGKGVGVAGAGISVSIGIGYFPDHGDDFAAVIERADAAMYEAKRAGGNGYVSALGRSGRLCRLN